MTLHPPIFFEMRVGDWTLQASSVLVRPHAYESITLNEFSGEEHEILGHRGHAQLTATFTTGHALMAGSAIDHLTDIDARPVDIVLREPQEPTRTFFDATLMSYNWTEPRPLDGFADLEATWRFMECDYAPVGLTLREQWTIRYPVGDRRRFHLPPRERVELRKLDWKKCGF